MTSLVSHIKRQGVAYVALFAALGGTSYAAITVTGTNVRNGSLTGQDLRDGSIAARDLQKGIVGAGGAGERGPQGERGLQGERGEQGAQGVQGEKGEKGERGATGTVDTSGFYGKAASDERYLAKAGKAADADQLDGVDSTHYARTRSVHKVLNYGTPMNHSTQAFFTVPELGSLAMGCYMNGSPHVDFDMWTYNGARTTFQQPRANLAQVFEPSGVSFAKSSDGREIDTFTIRYASQNPANAGMTTVEVIVVHNRSHNGSPACDITAQAVTTA